MRTSGIRTTGEMVLSAGASDHGLGHARVGVHLDRAGLNPALSGIPRPDLVEEPNDTRDVDPAMVPYGVRGDGWSAGQPRIVEITVDRVVRPDIILVYPFMISVLVRKPAS